MVSIPSTINKNGFFLGPYRPPQYERNLYMTKADLVDKVTALGDLTRRDGEVIVDTLFEAVIGALKGGDKIEIRGFGSFRTRQRNARTGRNPKTGAKVDVPAKRVPFFKPSKELRDSVNPSGVKANSSATKKIDPHHPPAM
jgi:integration host factor subunit beta